MLNKNQERELAYVVKVDEVKELPGYDRVESARVGGWLCIVPKGQFKAGDFGVYFEIDSKVDTNKPEFAFLEKRHGKIKTQKMCKSISQGLLMSFDDFIHDGVKPIWMAAFEKDMNGDWENADSRFLTAALEVKYSVEEDNKRKANPDKYKSMCSRHPKIFKQRWARWMMRRDWGKKIMFLLFGRKKDKKNQWPAHIASKTDQERIQNMIWVLQDRDKKYVATEKVDGSSFSAMIERGKFGKYIYYVCSRNVVFKDENQKCFYEDNVYFEAYDKYNLKNILKDILDKYEYNTLAIQSEVYGGNIQKRDYSSNEHKIAVFHIVANGVRLPMDKVVEICEEYGLPHVPIIDNNFILPSTIEELQDFTESEASAIDGKEKEGIVFYDKETGQQSFKFVSPNFLMKYHS